MDSAGNVLVTGRTDSAGRTSGGFDSSFNGGEDAFVAKISGLGEIQDALERQMQQISPLTFDGIDDDLTLTLGYVGLGRQVTVWVGQTGNDLRSVAIFTKTTDALVWELSVDIRNANVPLAQYVAVTSSQLVTILSAVGLYPNISDWDGYSSYPSLATTLPLLPTGDYTSVALPRDPILIAVPASSIPSMRGSHLRMESEREKHLPIVCWQSLAMICTRKT